MWWRTTELVVAIVATVLVVASPVDACRLCCPARMLLDPDAAVLRAPEGDFVHELERDGRVAPWPQPEPDPRSSVHAADVADVATAMADAGAEPARREDARSVVAAFRDAVDRCFFASKGAAPDECEHLGVPTGLSGEFTDYLRGALAYHRGNRDEARAAWKALLARPVGERRHRTVWATFMLGRLDEQTDPAAAVEGYRRARALVAEGFDDSIGLATASLGREARVELGRGDLVRAIHLYREQLAGDGRALTSLRWASASVLEAEPATMAAVANDPEARDIVTAYLASSSSWWSDVSTFPRQRTAAWLDAVEAAGARDLARADLLAWTAYQQGLMTEAERWLARSTTDTPIARWIRAKLLLRAGRLLDGERLLGATAQGFPIAERWRVWRPEDGGMGLAAPHREATAELGVVRLARADFAGALVAFVEAGYWTDAAYVAERVLTPDELARLVDRRWPAPASGPPTEEHLWDPDDAGAVAWRMRWLLGRRLLRLGRGRVAEPYFTPAMRPALDEYVRLQQAATRGTAGERAVALWRLAQLVHTQGMELLGSEAEPDWSAFWGNFAPYPTWRLRETAMPRRLAARDDSWSADVRFHAPLPKRSVLRVTAEERRRLARHHVDAERRFHYRWTALDLAWKAAQRMPDDADATADVLCVAGSWYAAFAPHDADRFYKALVRRCRRTALGREAGRRRWFPPCGGGAGPSPSA